ncbi:MAG: fibronectin type III domain-containing protein [Anaerolineae bacterium]
MRTRLHHPLEIALPAVLALVTLSTWSSAVLAINLSLNGSFDLFDPYYENGQPQYWRDFPEMQARGWTVRVLSGADRLHFMDSDTFGKFLQSVYGLSYLNYHLEGDKAQAFASQYPFSFVFSQAVTVENGIDYAFGGKLVTFWKGPGGEVDHTKIFKRIGVDPSGGSDPLAASVMWSDWDSRDNEWLSPTIAVTAQADRATLFIQVDNHGDNVGVQYLNTGYLDSFHFEKAPVATLDMPAQAPPGALWVSWSAMLPDPDYWSLWGYDVQLRMNGGDWQTIQQVNQPGGQSQGTTLQLQANAMYTLRVRAWQQRKPSGDPTIPALPGVWVERRVQVTGEDDKGSYSLFLPVIAQSPPPVPTPTPEPTVSPSPSPIPTTPPSPVGSDFRLTTVRMLSITENGGCAGNHHIFLSVIDQAGNPLFGPVIGDPPVNNFRVTSGDKNEPFLSYGVKTAEIVLYNNGTRLKVIENPAGTPVTSEQTPLLSTNTWEIPVEWLVEAGYCPDADHCSGLLCQGHYSYWVVFQAQ